MSVRNLAPHDPPPAALPAGGQQEFEIVLEPISHPELGEIRIGIDENLFAVGRNEAPFDAYPPALVADLSRRHARIFCERGAVHIADLDSKNGTMVNGVNLRQKTGRLRDGDEICFGGALSYRLRLGARANTAGTSVRLASLTLGPERADLGLEPIVISRFPFLIGKTDPAFARYKDAYPHQVNYLSRRHAHIFLKGGAPFVEDLGSTNGTFVAGKRLDEHAVALHEGDTLAFGGHHFVYRISLQQEPAAPDPTVTRLSPSPLHPAQAEGNADKTMFVGSADSFLDIFCIDHAQQQEDELNDEARKQLDEPDKQAGPRRTGGRLRTLLAEMAEAYGGGRPDRRRLAAWGLVFMLAFGGLGTFLYLRSAPEDDIRNALARGDYAQAARLADRYLAGHPGNAEVRAWETEALLRANVPQWLQLLQAHDFARANALAARIRLAAIHDDDARELADELAWTGALEAFVLGRGGSEAAIRVYADEDRMADLLRQWNRDPRRHQTGLAAIAAMVPAFRERYAEALSHLRKLQSDEAVYLPAIERLKQAIENGLNSAHPETLHAVLNEYAEKYPRIGGLDMVRQDLARYTDLLREAQARNLGPLSVMLQQASFATPPFRARFAALKSGELLPPADVLQQYQEVSKAWHAGDANASFSALQKMAAGSWADAAASDGARKKALLDQFAALQKARGTSGYEQQLLAFYGALDPRLDSYFINATQADIARYKDHALADAQQLLTQARQKWEQYRQNGEIVGTQRLETEISQRFRDQARLLVAADDDARRGMLVYTRLRLTSPPQWQQLQRQIDAEAALQRKSLLDLRDVLAPSLLKAKLALLGQGNEAQDATPGRRKAP